MNTQELKDRIAQIEKLVLEPIHYGGGNDLNEINAHLEKVHAHMAPVIFEGSEHRPPPLSDDIKCMVAERHKENPDECVKWLQSGIVSQLIFGTLIQEKAIKEFGVVYENKELGVTLPVKLIAQALMPIGVGRNDELGGKLRFIVSAIGAATISGSVARGGEAHEGAHVALGHLDKEFDIPDDRRKMEFDADHVGALSNGGTKDALRCAEYLLAYEQLAGKPAEWTEEKIQAELEKLHKAMGIEPGKNETMDEIFEAQAQKIREGLAWAARLKYPTVAERIEEISALDKQIEFQDKMLSAAPPEYGYDAAELRRERVQQAIAARHVKKGRGRE